METETELVVKFTSQARETFTAMQNHLADLEAHYGTSNSVRNTQASFGVNFARLIGMGGTICRDSELSLVSQTDIGMVVGMNWSPDSVEKMAERHGAEVAEWDANWPRTGTWSLNS